MKSIPILDENATLQAISFRQAVSAVEDALRKGFDPATDLERSSVSLHAGEFLIMPSETDRNAGIKVLTIAPNNPTIGLPRIQGYYLLFDTSTLTPRAMLDGGSLTMLRTPAVSLAAVRPALLRSRSPLDIVVFGAGPQGRAHVAALREVLIGERVVGDITHVVRSPASVSGAGDVIRNGTPEARAALRRAALVVCATTSRVPLFDSTLLRDDVVVVAVGSHEPDARELDAALMGRAQVIVEDRGTALRECGDVVLAIHDGALEEDALITMADVVAGRRTLHDASPVVFKSSGMSWEDLVIAEAIVAVAAPPMS